MGQKKLIKFAAIDGYNNVLQFPEGIKGKWNEYFKNDNPIVLELACGKGEYSVGLGRKHKDRNYIGVDIKGNRIYTGAKIALNEKLDNVAFLRAQIADLAKYFAPGEVSEIWIVFSDPFLKKESNRLTHPRFLHLYQRILKPGSRIQLKTDSRELYEFTLETIEAQGCTILENIADIYGKGLATGPLAIQTFYEKMHLAEGRIINYVAFTLPETEIKRPERFVKRETEAENADD